MRWLAFAALLLPTAVPALPAQEAPSPLPDSPGTVGTYRQTITVTAQSPCKPEQGPSPSADPPPGQTPGTTPNCLTPPNSSPYQRFLNTPGPFPLTPRQKGLLALHDLVDPGNIFTITANAGFTVGIDPHTGYGPGWRGFGCDVGYTYVQDATGEFVSTFVLDSLFHEDPRYHRSPQAPVPRRFLHALAHTVRSQHDDGTPMVNYSTLLTYPISAEIANLYVPGVHGNGPSTVERVGLGLAANPIDDLITEFLPDVAKRVHVRVIFVQQILNNLASRQPL